MSFILETSSIDGLSANDSEDEEERRNEIKKLLTEHFSNETFDEDDDEGDGDDGNHGSPANSLLDADQRNNNNNSQNEGLLNNNNNHYHLQVQDNHQQQHKNNHLQNQNQLLQHQQQHQGQEESSMENSYLKAINNTNGNVNGGRGDGGNINGSNGLNGNGNSTVSMLHKKHCPQNGDEGMSSEIWSAAGNDYEQLKTICDFRERQVLRAEETIANLAKEKRALSHQIGLMKTEMIQMKGNQDDLENIIQLRDDEIRYLKSTIDESSAKNDNGHREVISVKEECTRLMSENAMLQQKVNLLSSIGSSTHQIEIDQVIRQLREKHAKEIASWKSTSAELESELMAFKKVQANQPRPKPVETQNQVIQTDTVRKVSIWTETDVEFDENDKVRQQQQAQEKVNKSTELSAAAINTDQSYLEWKEEKDKMIAFYEREIEQYQRKLSTLPAELYGIWKKSQEELCPKKDAETSFSKVNDTSAAVSSAPAPIRKEMESLVVEQNEKEIQTEDLSGNSGTTGEALVKTHTEKDTSSVIIQTEETLETYKILARMIDQFAQDASESSVKAEEAESSLQSVQEELRKLRKRFKTLEKITTQCRKQWTAREEKMIRVHEATKTYYLNLLSKLSNKLEIVEIEERIQTSRISSSRVSGSILLSPNPNPIAIT